MANHHDLDRNQNMLKGKLRKKGYDWWWHSFTGHHEETGEEKAFVFEFFICNPDISPDKVSYGRLGQTPSYLMVKAMTWGDDSAQLHRFFPWKDVRITDKAPIEIEADDCFYSETYSRGTVTVTDAQAHPEWMCDNGSISWDLKIDKRVAFNVGYATAPFFRNLNAFEMYWHAEGMKTAFEGTVVYNGDRYIIRPEDCYGYADKNWGADFTTPWVWLSSNNLTSKLTGKKLTDSVFDIGGGKPKVFGISLNRILLSEFWYEGKSYEFIFAKFWTFARTKFDCHETDTQIIWHVEQWTPKAKMITDITCDKKDMLLVNYEAPNGKKLHNRLWNGGTGKGTVKLYKRNGKEYELLDDIIAENVGCEYGEFDKE